MQRKPTSTAGINIFFGAIHTKEIFKIKIRILFNWVFRIDFHIRKDYNTVIKYRILFLQR